MSVQLNPETIQAIADLVVQKLKDTTSDEVLTMNDAAKILNVKTSSIKSLRSTFSRFANPQKYKYPLKAYYTGSERSYKRSDVMKFMENRVRN
jgi:hypothetical protein